MGAAAAAVHHEEALAGEAAALEQAFDARAHFLVLQRGELVVERRDDVRVDGLNKQHERHPHDPGVQPPVRAHLVHQPEHRQQQRQTQHGTDGQALEVVGQPKLERHAVEAETLLDDELCVQRKRQLDHAADHDDRCDQRHAIRITGAKHAQPRLVDPVQPAEQRQGDQQRGLNRHFQHRQTGAGDGVVRGLAVHVQRD